LKADYMVSIVDLMAVLCFAATFFSLGFAMGRCSKTKK